MGKKNKTKSQKIKSHQPANAERQSGVAKSSGLVWILVVLSITAICLSPMLDNAFTNWDDENYVINNALLKGPDWSGIFSSIISSNYHPITILSLAINYAMTGLDPSSYLMMNLLLHLLNTGLVFYFVWTVFGNRVWVAAFTALIFGIHPMHVESVAWVSERKDLLYTLFFLLSLLQYWKFLISGKNIRLVFAFILFALSILSKPAAIILPFVLFLLDYWYGRKYSMKLVIEKIPFLLVSIILAIVTVNIQSKTAMTGLETYPLWSRFFFANYVSMIYIVRFFVPYPLSAFHPFPPIDNLGLAMYLSPLFMLALTVFVWIKRSNKLLMFGFLFYIINLLLVMQIVSVGMTIVSERYTYMPYIGIALVVGIWLDKYRKGFTGNFVWLGAGIVVLIFGFITFKQTDVWKDSESLWSAVIKHYPKAAVPRTNRANYNVRLATSATDPVKAQELYKYALKDCNAALAAKPDHAKGYEVRQYIYLMQKQHKEAFDDATQLIRLEPQNVLGHYSRGLANMGLGNMELALKDLSACLLINPDYHEALNSRGAILVNQYNQYDKALIDFNRAILLFPKGDYYLNRSVCYYKMGDIARSRTDAIAARENGKAIPEQLKNLLNL
jgi:protein O-mannosyl-transferase